MADLTTAQRLAAYRDELTAAGFAPGFVRDATAKAAPECIDQVDLEGELEDQD